MTYTYNPKLIRQRGKDQMRFELSDTFVDLGAETCALSDEEYEAMLEGLGEGQRAWQFAKLAILKVIMLKVAYQVDTKMDVLTYGFGDRARLWKDLYEMLKKELEASVAIPTLDPSAAKKPPYFYTGMQENERMQSPPLENFPFRNITE